MASNIDENTKKFLARLITLEQEKRDNAEDRKELLTEMKRAALPKTEIAGLKLAAKRHFETGEERMFRETAEEFAEALGAFSDTPLGDAAVRAAAH